MNKSKLLVAFLTIVIAPIFPLLSIAIAEFLFSGFSGIQPPKLPVLWQMFWIQYDIWLLFGITATFIVAYSKSFGAVCFKSILLLVAYAALGFIILISRLGGGI